MKCSYVEIEEAEKLGQLAKAKVICNEKAVVMMGGDTYCRKHQLKMLKVGVK